jgi:hypothetical protein
MSEPINWHFPRPKESKFIIDRFESGFSTSIVLFAPRKSGKTEFVMRDVIPEAKARGYYVVTVDFWDDKANPKQCIRRALESTFQSLPPKLQAKALALSSVDATISTSPSVSASSSIPAFETFQDAFRILRGVFEGGKNGKVILFLDEVQHIGTNPDYDSIAASLRTFIDKSQDWLLTIMTGSSQDGLIQTFRRTKAPFYNHASIEKYPVLNTDFVSHMLNCYALAANKMLDSKAAVEAFRKLHRSPDRFHQLVKLMVLEGITDFDQALSNHDELLINEDILQTWESIQDVDSAVLELIALIKISELPPSVYSTAAQEYLEKRTGELCNKTIIGNAMGRLKKIGWIFSPNRGEWEFESEEIFEFIKKIISC